MISTNEGAIKLANAINIYLDFLVGQNDVAFDQDALKRITDNSTLPQDDKQFMLRTIDGLLEDIKTRKAYAS